MAREEWNARGKELPIAHALWGKLGGARGAREQRIQNAIEARLKVAWNVGQRRNIAVACVKSHGTSTDVVASSSKILASELSLNLASPRDPPGLSPP
jgi:undecaprenyl pyrophosphate synthase